VFAATREAARVRRGREFWQQLVDEVDGGASIADVARQYRVQPRTLSWWRWKLHRDGESGTQLLPVVVRPLTEQDSGAIALRVRDVIIRVDSGTDVAYVAALVEALRG
jgi:transposase-like protein